MRTRTSLWIRRALMLSACVLGCAGVTRAATITIVNMDGAGEGFNDPTLVAPVGGNPGTTVGAQRLFVFQTAANIWGGLLPSTVQIKVDAQFNPLSCTATSGVLGSAGPTEIFRDFPGTPLAGHWYNVALANRLAGADLDAATDDISATFNSGLGTPTCLPQGWYYGVDGNEGTKIELLPVVLHEIGHGLGFLTVTNGQTGAYFSGFPSVFDHNIFDDTQGLHWDQMTAGQRVTSGINCARVVWDGANVTARAPSFLGPKPLLRVNSPPVIAADYQVGLPSFGPALSATGVTGQVVLVNDGDAYPTNGCEAIVNSVAGKIAMIDRGTCAFTVKIKNAQNAGAIAVIVADSLAGCPAGAMGGTDATITIPSVRITLSDGALIKAQLGAGVNVTLKSDPSQLAGADASGHVLLYTPNPYQPGSSVSHWDTSAEPSLLMEPAITSGLSSSVDLTLAHFADIGWFQGFLSVGNRPRTGFQLGPSFPNPAQLATSISFSLDREESVELSIYDLSGRLVTRLVQGRVSQGDHTVKWDGTDGAGRLAAPGIYLYRLKSPSVSESRHLVLVH